MIECLGTDDAGHERLNGLVLNACELHHAGEIWKRRANTRCEERSILMYRHQSERTLNEHSGIHIRLG
jgi:hypothetical protein